MIEVEKHRLFKAYFKKLSAKQKTAFYERLSFFLQDPRNPILRVHRLQGDLQNFYSFSVTGNLRVIFDWPQKDRVILHKIGTHNQVY